MQRHQFHGSKRCTPAPCLHFAQEPRLLPALYPGAEGRAPAPQAVVATRELGECELIPGEDPRAWHPAPGRSALSARVAPAAVLAQLGCTSLGKSIINWAACLQEAEAALGESSTVVQRARSVVWLLGSPCCSNQETSVSASLGRAGLPGEHMEKGQMMLALQSRPPRYSSSEAGGNPGAGILQDCPLSWQGDMLCCPQ